MMLIGDRGGSFENRPGGGIEDGIAYLAVGLHDGPFLGTEFARFFEDMIGDGQFADVMEKGAEAGQRIRRHNSHPLQDLNRVAEQVTLRMVFERSGRNRRHPEDLRKKIFTDTVLQHGFKEPLR